MSIAASFKAIVGVVVVLEQICLKMLVLGGPF